MTSFFSISNCIADSVKKFWGVDSEVIPFGTIPICPKVDKKNKIKNIIWVGNVKANKRPQYLVQIAKAFSNSRVRIEGNTDNVGNPATNKALSEKRARAVADYLISTYNMPRNRFIIVGNGPDKPVGSNDTEEGKSKNRRTELQIIK